MMDKQQALNAVAKSPGLLLLALTLSLSGSSSPAEDKINYADQVLPLVEANCSKCHNSDKKKADLDLTSYQGALKGSGSGAVVVSGSPDGSKLWKALTHAEEPFMPPNRPKLSDKELDVFKKWITDGLLETAGGKALAAARPGVDLELKPEDLAKPEGPPPMPHDLPLETVVHTPRMRAITGLAVSPWAPLAAVAGQQQVLLFNTETLGLVGILPFVEGEPSEVRFSHNGKLLLASGGRGAKSGRVVVWDVVTGEHVMTLGQEYDTVLTADLRPDQSSLALGGPGRLVKIYSTKTGEVLHKIKKHTDWVTVVAFSPNGQILASADRNGGISLWDPDSAQELFTLAGHKSSVTALSWRGDSKLLASSSEDGTVKLWDVKEGKQFKSGTAHNGGTLCVSYGPGGRLATCGRDQAATLWSGNGGKLRQLEFSGDLPLRVRLTHDNSRVIAADFEGRVMAWSTADGKRVGELNANPPPLGEQLAAARKALNEVQARVQEAEAKVVAAEAELARRSVALESASNLLVTAHSEASETKVVLEGLRHSDLESSAEAQTRLAAATEIWSRALLETTNALQSVQARAKELKTAEDSLAQARADVPQPALKAAQEDIRRLEAAQALSAGFRARQELATRRREQERLAAVRKDSGG